MAQWVKAGSGARTTVYKQLLAPTASNGVAVGDLWIDLTSGLYKQATSITPVTWTELTAAADLASAIGILGLAHGGTNADLSATGGTSQVLKQVTAGAAITVAQLAATDLSNSVTGTGHVVLDNTPTLITPVLGAATATSVNKVAVTAPATAATLTIANGATLTASASATVSGTNTGDQTTVSGNAGSATLVATTAVSTAASYYPLFVASTTNSNQAADLDADITYNPSTNTLTTTTFVGALTGNASGSSGSCTGNAASATTAAAVTNGGALNTPASGVLTNCTGTAAGLTAGTVTTNANLTGPVTSSGNATTIASGVVTEAMQVLADNTTQDCSTSKHGYLKKLDNTATHYMDGTGNWSVPPVAQTTGSWTPTDASGAALSLTTSASYTIIGNIVFAYAQIIFPATADASGNVISGFPATSGNANYAIQGHVSSSTSATVRYFTMLSNNTAGIFYDATGTRLQNVQLSGTTNQIMVIYPKS